MTSISKAKFFVQNNFGNENFRVYNVKIAKQIGVEEAIVLNDLIDFFSYIEEEGKLIKLEGHKGLWFYYSSTRCEERTALRRKALFRVVSSLKAQKLILVVNSGVPQKRHFIIDFVAVYKLLTPKKNSKKNSNCPKRDNQKSQMGHLKVPNGTSIKEPNKNPKKTTTTDARKEDQKGRSKKQEVVVIFSSLKKIKINHVLMEKISGEYTETEVDLAVERCLRWKTRANDTVGILTVLKDRDTWTDVEDKQEIEDRNRKHLETLSPLEGKTLGPMAISIGPDYIEFSAGITCFIYNIKNKDFIHMVDAKINDLKKWEVEYV